MITPITRIVDVYQTHNTNKRNILLYVKQTNNPYYHFTSTHSKCCMVLLAIQHYYRYFLYSYKQFSNDG
nr:MAG TPA: hypothetical protein [Caudoviricetes sp.]